MKLLCCAIIQARIGSTRLPGKVLKDLCGKPLLWHVIQRAKACEKIDQVIVATTQLDADDAIEQLAGECSVICIRGEEQNVLERYYRSARSLSADVIVRITGDCPLFSPATVDGMVELCIQQKADYVCHDPNYPTFETGVEVLTFSALHRVYQSAHHPYQKEHVTLFIREHPEEYIIALAKPPLAYRRTDIRVTVDHQKDLDFIREIYKRLYRPGEIITLNQVIKLIDEKPELKQINAVVENSVANRYSASDEIKQKLSRAAKISEDINT